MELAILNPALKPDITSDYFTVASPILLNYWKHHAGALRRQIEGMASAGAPALKPLAGELVVIGTELMDLYVGTLAPAEIAGKVLETSHADQRLPVDAYRAWLTANGGYQLLTFAEDASRWVLRQGDPTGRYVHVHPARWAPQTLRVRANVLKTAVMVLGYVAVFGGDPLDVALINDVRKQYLGFSPIGRLTGDQGLRGVIDAVRSAP
jgi:hypothetical protein